MRPALLLSVGLTAGIVGAGFSRALLISIMVDSVAKTPETISASGGEIVQPVGAHAPEITARFRDPAGNVLSLYQHGG